MTGGEKTNHAVKSFIQGILKIKNKQTNIVKVK